MPHERDQQHDRGHQHLRVREPQQRGRAAERDRRDPGPAPAGTQPEGQRHQQHAGHGRRDVVDRAEAVLEHEREPAEAGQRAQHARQPWPPRRGTGVARRDRRRRDRLRLLDRARLRAQRGEQHHVANARRAGDQHHQAVDADPEPAGRRQPVLQRAHVALVDRAALGLEALALVDRVVELAVGVGQLAGADERLEALGQERVVAVRAGQRRDLARVVEHERRLDQRVLGCRLEDLGHQLPGAPARLVDDAVPVADRARVLEWHRRMHGLARVLFDQLGHRRPPPRRREVDLRRRGIVVVPLAASAAVATIVSTSSIMSP